MKMITKAAVVSAVMFATAMPAFAAVSVDVTTALGDAKADVATIGGLVLVVIIAAAAFKYLRRAL
jgi:uncharacterized YccA/Bax inhibitor family protein